MKKTFLILLCVLLLPLFSSCIIVTHEYDITLFNNSDYLVTDWYVEDEDGRNYTKSSDFVPVQIDQESTIKNLDEDTYRVVLSFILFPESEDYFCSNFVYLDEDVVYKVYHDRFYSRSQENPGEPRLYLEDANGNIIPLHKLEK